MKRWFESNQTCAIVFLLLPACGGAEPAPTPATAKSVARAAAGSGGARARPRAAPSANGGIGGTGSADMGSMSAGDGSAGTSANSDDLGGGHDQRPSTETNPDRGPYFTSGQWHGYFWTAHHGDGTTLEATNFAAARFETPVCIKGTVAPTVDSTGNAIVGVNVNQENSADMLMQTIAPSLDGLRGHASARRVGMSGAETHVPYEVCLKLSNNPNLPASPTSCEIFSSSVRRAINAGRPRDPWRRALPTLGPSVVWQCGACPRSRAPSRSGTSASAACPPR